jgi:hypothetical protein
MNQKAKMCIKIAESSTIPKKLMLIIYLKYEVNSAAEPIIVLSM